MTSPEMPLLLVIAGPTASGKTSLALHLAKQLPGEIVNCDSMQMVRGLEVGTAKPTREERSRAPHHLFDIVDPEEFYSAGRYMSEARSICREIAARARVPIVVGGTGLYLRALLEGIFLGPGRTEPLRKRLKQMATRWGSDKLHRVLSRFDPASAEGIQPRDQIRVVRALEVYFVSGRPLGSQRSRRQPLEGFRVVKLALNPPREELYTRINKRVELMFEGGLIEEVKTLLRQGVPSDCKGFEAIGYRQVIRCLEHEIECAEALDLTARDTRRYAKRQLTWFRREPDLHWIEAFGHQKLALEEAVALLRSRAESSAGLLQKSARIGNKGQDR